MSEQPSPELTAWAEANQRCRDIAQQVGVRNCDDSPEWRAAESEAGALYDAALAAGHTTDEVLKAGRAR